MTKPKPTKRDAPERPAVAAPVTTTAAPPGMTLRSIEASVTRYQGPLPSPAVLREFEAIRPGAADILFSELVAQGHHRRELEAKAVASEIRRAYWGMMCGFTLGLVGLMTAAFFAHLGHPISGAAVGGLSLVSLVSVFVKGSSDRRKEREKKTQTMAEALSLQSPQSPSP